MRTRVLIVEDEPVIAEMMCIILEEQGFEVDSSSDIERVKVKLHENGTDIVLLDLKLKGEGGNSICKYIKRSPHLKHIPVIIVSGNSDIEKIAKESGADDFIEKPFEINFLVKKVQTFTQVDV